MIGLRTYIVPQFVLGGPSSVGWEAEYDTYSDLPLASEHTGKVELVKNDSGIWPFKKKAGFWRSTGSAWQWLGVLAFASLSDVNIAGITNIQGIQYDSANGGFIPYMPLQFAGFSKISVQATAPAAPSTNDVWFW